MFIGRENERDQLRRALSDRSKSQMIVIYGRRRIGKSRLIRECVKGEQRVLNFEGVQGEPTEVQIGQFLSDLSRQTGRVKLAARSWSEAFQGLGELMHAGRWVLVFDEFPWMAAGQSRIVADLKLHWDRWTAANKNLALFLCGSVASFMVRHLIHSKALHNRKTVEMRLEPLSPAESGRFINKRSVWEKAKLYMCLGGVPKYLEQVNPAQSVEQNLNRLCFTAGGFFVNEFDTLFKEQFRVVRVYERIVQALSRSAMSLSDLALRVGIAKGGGLHDYLANLIQADFVREYSPHAPNLKPRLRTKTYKLCDPFLIFCLRYIRPNRRIIALNRGENLFPSLTGVSIDQYFGFAFERLCDNAVGAILQKLKLALADVAAMGPYFQRGKGAVPGLQIDNLIMRRDGAWTAVEYKFHDKPVGMEVVAAMRRKLALLDAPARVTVEKVLVAADGVTKTVTASGYFDRVITLEDIL